MKKKIDPLLWGHEQAQIKRAMEELNATRHGLAQVAREFVLIGGGRTYLAKKAARISLAADKGYLNLLRRQRERR